MWTPTARIRFALVACVALAACSGPAKTDGTGPSRPSDAGLVSSASRDGAAGSGRDDGAGNETTDTPPTDDECAVLFDHMLAIELAAHNEAHPDRRLEKADLVEIRAKELPAFVDHCASVYNRAIYACAMTASSRDQLVACEEP